MPYPGPGTTFPDGIVYKTTSLAQFLPPGVTIPAEYADLAFTYHDQSVPGQGVTIADVGGQATLEYTSNVFDVPSTLTIADVGAQGPNGFQFTDTSGALWTVLDKPVTDGVAVDPLFPVAEAEFPQYAALLKTLQIELDVVTGGNPIVFPVFPLDGSAPCFARGTRIRTVSGDVAVEDLAEGDRVVLATGGEAPIVWIGRRRVHVGRHAYPATVAPIRIAPGALGRAQPERPLRVSPDHALFVDGVLVPAGLLVNGSTIVQETVVAVEYFHIELPTHAVLLAEGLSAESYLDTGNRGMFANTPLARTPTAPPATPCAEMVLDGERLARIRDALTPALSIAS